MEQENLHNYIESVREWYYLALTSFTLYQQLMIKKSPNQVGLKVAERNLDTCNDYNGVFTVVLATTRYTSIMSLAVLFVEGKDKRGKPSMSLSDLLREVNDNYAVDKDELKAMTSKLESNQTVAVLKVLRNQYFAHADKKPDVIEISDSMLIELLDLTKHIVAFAERHILNLDIDGDQYRHNTTSDSNIESDVSMSLDKLFTKLQS
jgi:hypothetical protein